MLLSRCFHGRSLYTAPVCRCGHTHLVEASIALVKMRIRGLRQDQLEGENVGGKEILDIPLSTKVCIKSPTGFNTLEFLLLGLSKSGGYYSLDQRNTRPFVHNIDTIKLISHCHLPPSLTPEHERTSQIKRAMQLSAILLGALTGGGAFVVSAATHEIVNNNNNLNPVLPRACQTVSPQLWTPYRTLTSSGVLNLEFKIPDEAINTPTICELVFVLDLGDETVDDTVPISSPTLSDVQLFDAGGQPQGYFHMKKETDGHLIGQPTQPINHWTCEKDMQFQVRLVDKIPNGFIGIGARSRFEMRVGCV
ncbi:hypothetical protein B0H66DRAFT_156506 [Apodospora peruviana]|uniref:Ubiquitin 3 binding protein But2 C-terminal domain-containing protein n=1 Tax=Apodospora peruviana TaxID=516989 RepID=A0AAE0IJX8_9PEZI|nr:hypothetical protein B0H66DRAFT_156506 [Apodospora peruviana]